MIYDIFYVSREAVNDSDWKSFRQRFPSSQKIDNVKTFDDIKKKAFTKFFWVVWDDLIVSSEFIFDYRIPKWDEEYIHVFKNNQHYDGICLFPKYASVSEREFNNRFFVNKKEIDIIASIPKTYDIFKLNSYDEYLEAINNSTSTMFWAVWNDVELVNELSYQVPYYDHHLNHVFLNDSFYDGVCLFSKKTIVSKKEFDHRFYLNRKEIDIKLSIPKSYDIVFISYNEINADENYKKLQERFPKAKRISGVKGIHQAHIEAAKISDTELFWVVDGDAVIEDTFNFSVDYVPHYDVGNREIFYKTVRVWKSRNPVNDLEYGNGGVKLLPKKLTLGMNLTSTDMTTSISEFFKPESTVSNINAFNTDPFTTWRSAFRECVKLSSKVIDRGYDDETDQRLVIWCMSGSDRPFGKYAIGGARAGKEFGERYIGIDEILVKINDFEWLESEFKKWQLKND